MMDVEPREVLAGRRILVVEDEALVAMLIEHALRALGCEVVGPVSSTKEAISLIQTGRVDAATLDINLSREEVYPVAEILEAQGIKFILITGYDEENILRRYGRWPLMQKPFTDERLAALLACVLSEPRGLA